MRAGELSKLWASTRLTSIAIKRSPIAGPGGTILEAKYRAFRFGAIDQDRHRLKLSDARLMFLVTALF
jgi:hypothetical protein